MLFKISITTFEHPSEEHPKKFTFSQVAINIQDALNRKKFGKYVLISTVALSSKSICVVSLYQTVPPFNVSTSDQNGAIILASLATGNGSGVYVCTGSKKEITPLVLTY